jgi:hypothetical protein
MSGLCQCVYTRRPSIRGREVHLNRNRVQMGSNRQHLHHDSAYRLFLLQSCIMQRKGADPFLRHHRIDHIPQQSQPLSIH